MKREFFLLMAKLTHSIAIHYNQQFEKWKKVFDYWYEKFMTEVGVIDD